MPESGIEKMEERAEVVRSRWRIVAAVATALLVAKSLASKAMALIRRKPNWIPLARLVLVDCCRPGAFGSETLSCCGCALYGAHIEFAIVTAPL